MNEKKIYYLTFGQKSPAHNGWIEISAVDYEDAMRIANAAYGERNWSMIREDVKPEYYPNGCLGKLV